MTTKTSLKTLIKKTNDAARNVNKANSELFETVKDAVDTLGGDAKDLKQYKAEIEYDRSTINKMIRVAKNGLVTRLSDSLPKSYQTLYEIVLLIRKIEEDQFIALVHEGRLNEKSSKADVARLRKTLGPITASNASGLNAATPGNSFADVLTILGNLDELTEDQVKKIIELARSRAVIDEKDETLKDAA